MYTHVCFFGWSWAQHPNLHFVGGAGLITLTNTFLVELGSAPWYRLGPTPQLPCALAPSMRGQGVVARFGACRRFRAALVSVARLSDGHEVTVDTQLNWGRR